MWNGFDLYTCVNQPDGVRRALESVLQQTYRDFEVTVADDSDNDAIEQVVRSLDFGGALIYQRNQQRLGSPGNWNAAIEMASGEYIKILHHDDWFSSQDSLDRYVRMLDENPDCDFGFSSSMDRCLRTGATKLQTPGLRRLRQLRNDPWMLLSGNVVGAPSATIFRSTALQRFDPLFKWLVDVEFYIRILTRNGRFIHCPEPLACIGSGSSLRVTAQCQGNRDVELVEYLRLLGMMPQGRRLTRREERTMLRLFHRYELRTEEELAACCVDFPPPKSAIQLLRRSQFRGFGSAIGRTIQWIGGRRRREW